MRIYQKNLNKLLDAVLLYLPMDEALNLLEELGKLLKNPNDYVIKFKGKDKDGKLTKELTIKIYNDENINNFDETSKKLIIEGKVSK